MKRKIFRIIYIINIVIIIAILAYLVYLAFSKYNNNSNNNVEYAYFQFRGYKLKIPTDIENNTNNDSELLLYSPKASWSARIVIVEDNNNDIFSNLDRLEEIYKHEGYDVSELKVHTLNDQQYVTVNRKMGDNAILKNVLLGYCRLNDNRLAEIMLNDSIDTSRLNYAGFESAVKILQSAEYDSAKDEEYNYWTLSLKKPLQELYGEESTE